jgi:hypothetical protein
MTVILRSFIVYGLFTFGEWSGGVHLLSATNGIGVFWSVAIVVMWGHCLLAEVAA